jgi:MbtH protein
MCTNAARRTRSASRRMGELIRGDVLPTRRSTRRLTPSTTHSVVRSSAATLSHDMDASTLHGSGRCSRTRRRSRIGHSEPEARRVRHSSESRPLVSSRTDLITGSDLVSDFDYVVVKNRQGQYAIWPSVLSIPAGWEPQRLPGPKAECLEFIAAVWKDAALHPPRREAASGAAGGATARTFLAADRSGPSRRRLGPRTRS